MEVGVVVPRPPAVDGAAVWRHLKGVAGDAESLGIATMWVAGDPYTEFSSGLDPLVTLAALARTTTTIRLGVLGLAAEGHPPGVLAKTLATIDVLSAGRLIVALAPTFAPDETLAILRGAFTGEELSFAGQAHAVAGLVCRPRPIQRPAPPLWAMDETATGADGWLAGPDTGLEEFCRRVEGRDTPVGAVIAMASLGSRPAAAVASWASAGASHLVVGLQALPFEQTRTDLRLLASAIR